MQHSNRTRVRRVALFALLVVLVLLLVGLVRAQAQLPPGVDPLVPATWFVSAAGYGALVMFAVNFLKANVLNVKGWGTIAVAALLAFGGPLVAATGALGAFGVSLEGTFPELLAYGLTAFTTSAGSWDSLSRLKAQPAGVTAVVDVSNAPAAVAAAKETVQKEARDKK